MVGHSIELDATGFEGIKPHEALRGDSRSAHLARRGNNAQRRHLEDHPPSSEDVVSNHVAAAGGRVRSSPAEKSTFHR